MSAGRFDNYSFKRNPLPKIKTPVAPGFHFMHFETQSNNYSDSSSATIAARNGVNNGSFSTEENLGKISPFQMKLNAQFRKERKKTSESQPRIPDKSSITTALFSLAPLIKAYWNQPYRPANLLLHLTGVGDPRLNAVLSGL